MTASSRLDRQTSVSLNLITACKGTKELYLSVIAIQDLLGVMYQKSILFLLKDVSKKGHLVQSQITIHIQH